MDKVAKLKSVAKGLAAVGAGGILGAGAGVSALENNAKNKRNARAKKGWETRRRKAMTKQAQDNALVKKVHASGYLPKQLKHPKMKPAAFKKDRRLSDSDTKKGTSRAFVAKDKMPVSIEPIKAPRSKTLAQIGRSIKNG